MHPQPLICVRKVEASCRNQRLLGLKSAHGGREYERMEWRGRFMLQPHHWEIGGRNQWELWLRDLDGYTVVLASPDGTAGPE